MLKVKSSVRPRSLWIACAALNAAGPWDVVITSGNDSQHRQGSKHYTDEALDLRLSTIPFAALEPYLRRMRARLGSDYQVIREGDHVHVEYDPPVKATTVKARRRPVRRL